MKVADLEFINKNNCKGAGVDSLFVGDNTLVFFRLRGCSNDELMDILNYKSWILKSWKTGRERKYFVFKWSDYGNDKIIWCYAGFSSILIRYLQNKLGYVVNGKELFKAKEIVELRDMKYRLWDFQEEAVKEWIDVGCYGIIKAPTGSGKSVIGCSIMRRMGTRTIICVHTGDLLINVWFNYLIEQFGEGIRSRIGIIGGGLSKKDRKLMRISSDSFEENIRKDIVVATSQSLLNKLDILGKEKFGLMIVDEIHHYPSEQFKNIANAIRAPARLGLSATLVRPDGMSPMMNGLIGDVVYRIGIRELVRQGLLVEPVFQSVVLSDKVNEEKIKKTNLKLLDYARYVKRVSAGSTTKFSYIIDLCVSLTKNNKKFMIYTDFVSNLKVDNKKKDDNWNYVYTRGDYASVLIDRGIRVTEISADMSGVVREAVFNMLKNGELDGIVFGSLGNEGINIPIVDSVIMCNCTASTIRYPQRVGRAMRVYGNKKNAFIYEILLKVDKELEWSKENFFEYGTEGYMKERVWLDDNGQVLKKDMVI